MNNLLIVLPTAVFLAASALSSPVYGQERTSEIKLKIVNSETKEAVSTASVMLKGKDSDFSRFSFSDEGGVAMFTDLPYGDYVLSVRMVSYDEIVREIIVADGSTDLGTVEMNPNSTMLDEYVVEAVAMRTSLKGDTIVYNADAFKVTRDAVLQRLLSKLPGIEVGADGSITAFGQEVKKILVDGKEFFAKDIKTTVENLPAEMVDNIEVYDELSDHAKLTGTDDGEGYKAINIVTKKDKRNGMFGKVTALYGIDDIYSVDANMTVYNERRRFSLFASARNDIFNTISYGDDADMALGSGSFRMSGNFFGGFMDFAQSGRNSMYSVNGSYNDVFGKREQLNMDISFRYSHAKSKGTNNRESWLFTDQTNTLYQNSYTDNRSNNNTYYSSVYMTYEGDKTTLEGYAAVSTSFGKSSLNSSVSQENLATDGTLSPIQQQLSDTKSNKDRLNIYTQLDWGYKFDKEGRALGISFTGQYQSNDEYENPRQYFYYPPYISLETADSLFMRRNYLDGKSYGITGSVTYSEPINERNSLIFRCRFDYDYSDHDSRVYLWDYLAAIYNPEYDTDLSNIYNSGKMNNRAGVGYNYKGSKVTLDASILFRNSRLLNKQTTPLSLRRTYSFNNVEYSSYLKWAVNSNNTLTARFNSSGYNPSLEQLLEVPDLTTGTQIVMVGNPELESSYHHRLNLEYRRTNVEKGTTFYIYMNGSMNFNPVVSSTTMGSGIVIPNSGGLTLGEGGRLIEFVNMKGTPIIYGSMGAGYSFPVNPIKSNMTVSGGYSYSQSPTLFNSRKIMMKSSGYNGTVKFDSNISENIDFSLSNYFSYTGSKGGATTAENRYKYIDNNIYAKLKWIIWQGITVDATLRYSFLRDITFNDNRNQLSADIFVGKKLFKDDMGEISVGVVDVFNRTKSYDRIVSALSIVYTTHYNRIGRYFAVRFTYNFRNYKAAQSPPQNQQYFF